MSWPWWIKPKKLILYQDQRIFKSGDKNKKLLAFLGKPIPESATIARIYDNNTNLHLSHTEITDTFLQFYSELDKSQAHYTLLELCEYVDSIPFRILTQAQRLSIIEPISMD